MSPSTAQLNVLHRLQRDIEGLRYSPQAFRQDILTDFGTENIEKAIETCRNIMDKDTATKVIGVYFEQSLTNTIRQLLTL